MGGGGPIPIWMTGGVGWCQREAGQQTSRAKRLSAAACRRPVHCSARASRRTCGGTQHTGAIERVANRSVELTACEGVRAPASTALGGSNVIRCSFSYSKHCTAQQGIFTTPLPASIATVCNNTASRSSTQIPHQAYPSAAQASCAASQLQEDCLVRRCCVNQAAALMERS